MKNSSIRTFLLFLLVPSSGLVQAFSLPPSSIRPVSSSSSSSSQLQATPPFVVGRLVGRFRNKKRVRDQAKDPIKVGDTLEDADVERLVPSTDEDKKMETTHDPVSIQEIERFMQKPQSNFKNNKDAQQNPLK